MAQDRVDLSLAAKDLATRMARLRIWDGVPLNRVLRYLANRRRCRYVYRWQEIPSQWDIYTDSDWGNDTETRRSTSGGMVMMGIHLLHQGSEPNQSSLYPVQKLS